jgi:hypothetical protein
MTAIARLPASEAYVSALRRSESAVTPKLFGLDLPDEVRQKIYYWERAAGAARAATDRLVMATDFTDAADHPAVLQTVRQASRRRPSAAVRAGEDPQTQAAPPCSCRLCLRIFACPPARSAAGRPGVAVLNRVEPC